MRWFPESPWAEACFGSILLLAALFVATPARSQSVEASADWSATVTEAGMVDPDVEAGRSETLPVKLKLDDRVAALQAIQFTLDEVADGATYLWHRKNGELHGYVKPLDSYLDDQGRVCRRLQLALTVGEFSREVEGVACRSEDKRWMLGH